MLTQSPKRFKKVRYQGARTGTRFVAASMDLLYVTLFCGLILFLGEDLFVALLPKTMKAWEKLAIFGSAVLLFHTFIYAPIFETTGKSPGKAAMGLKILNNDDRIPATISQHFLRAILRFVFYVPLFAALLAREKIYFGFGLIFMSIPYLWHFFDRERQTLVDIWSGIIVLERVEEATSRDKESMRKEEIPSIWDNQHPKSPRYGETVKESETEAGYPY